MHYPVTTISAVILGFWLIWLSVRVISGRQTTSVSLGDGGDEPLSRRIRAQANLSEYAPMGLILMFLAEAQTALTWLLALFATIFVIGRLSHGYALSFTASSAAARVRGMIMTFAGLLLLALLNLWLIFSNYFYS